MGQDKGVIMVSGRGDRLAESDQRRNGLVQKC